MRPIIVAEIGLNHCGDIGIARRLIAQAAAIGADYVKFQKRTIEACYTAEYLDQPRVTQWGATVRDEKRGLEFEKNEYDEIERCCKQQGVKWFASPWDVESLQFLLRYEPDFIKIASACINNAALLDTAMLSDIPWILSTGMASMGTLLNVCDAYGYNPIKHLLHCVAVYPTPPPDMNLAAMATLRRLGKSMSVGYSHHSPDGWPLVVAAVLGAEMLEFHLAPNLPFGSADLAASMSVAEAARAIRIVSSLDDAMGDGAIAPHPDALAKGRHYRWRI